jgi:hypothetical protein
MDGIEDSNTPTGLTPGTQPDRPGLNWRTLPLTLKAILVANVVTACSLFLTWASFLFIQISGIDTGYGQVSLAALILAVILYAFALNKTDHQKSLVLGASVMLMAATASHVIFGLALSNYFESSDGEMFSGLASRGAGYKIGLLAAAAAFAFSIRVANDVVRGTQLKEVTPDWKLNDIAGVASAAIAPSLLVFYDTWQAPLIGGVLLLVVWYYGQKQKLFVTSIRPLMLAASLLTVTGSVIIGLAVDSETSTSNQSENQFFNFSSDEQKSCAEVFAAGTDTNEAINTSSCEDSDTGVLTFVLTQEYECQDGLTLHVNDYGWGKDGGTWNSPNGAVAPIGTCNGLASDLCSEAFKPGTTTLESWGSDGATCVGDDGEISFVISLSMSCWKSDKKYVLNDYGWGFINEPWQKGDPPYDC